MTPTAKRAAIVGGIVGVGVLVVAGVAMASTKSQGGGAPPDGPPGPPPGGGGGRDSDGCVRRFTPASDCSDCLPAEVDMAVQVANDRSKPPGSYGPILVSETKRMIWVHKPKQGWGNITTICTTS